MACKSCRQRKVKCSLTKPVCDHCNARRIDCQYEDNVNLPRGKASTRYRERLERLEQILVNQQRSENVMSMDGISPLRETAGTGSRNNVNLTHSPEFTRDEASLSSGATNLSQRGESSFRNRCPAQNNSTDYSSITDFPPHPVDDLLGESLRGPAASPSHHTLEQIDRLGNSFSEPRSNHLHGDGPPTTLAGEDFQYTGASSGLLPLSRNVINFSGRIQQVFGKPEFEESLEHCQTALTAISECVERLSHFSTEKIGLVNQYDYPIPSAKIATEYIDVYFNTCQVIFPVVRRASFETAWRKSQEPSARFDVSWHMLQNAVLAMGAFRKISASTPESYKCAKEEGYRFFLNSLNMQALMLPNRTNLMAVQALCVMSMFAQVIGNPNLAYTCSSFASSLAQSKGLHKAPAVGWGLPSDCRQEQERLFWVLYFFDKVLALDSGRPSIIDDAEISCSFPENNATYSEDLCTASPEVFLNFARFARVCSKIKQALYSATALNRDTTQLFPVRDALCIQLGIWLDSVPAVYNVKTTPFRMAKLSADVRPVRAILLRIAYLYAVCCIHRRFSSLFVERSPNTTESNEYLRSDEEHLRASRELILLLGQLEMDVDTPSWFFAYNLLAAAIPLFLHVIENPLNASAGDDVSLLNVATGIFGRLEFITAGELAFTGVGDLARLATDIIAKSKLQSENASSTEQRELKRKQVDWERASSTNDQHFHVSEPFSLEELSNFQVLESIDNPFDYPISDSTTFPFGPN